MAAADCPQRLVQKPTPPIPLSCSQQRLPALNLWTAQPLLPIPIYCLAGAPQGGTQTSKGAGRGWPVLGGALFPSSSWRECSLGDRGPWRNTLSLRALQPRDPLGRPQSLGCYIVLLKMAYPLAEESPVPSLPLPLPTVPVLTSFMSSWGLRAMSLEP